MSTKDEREKASTSQRTLLDPHAAELLQAQVTNLQLQLQLKEKEAALREAEHKLQLKEMEATLRVKEMEAEFREYRHQTELKRFKADADETKKLDETREKLAGKVEELSITLEGIKFDILDHLGRGGRHKVYRTLWQNSEYALKVPLLQTSARDVCIERHTVDELRQKLGEEENFLPTITYAGHVRTALLVQPVGISLKEHYQKLNSEENQPVQHFKTIASRVLKIIKRLHSIGYFHCDLRHENIIVKNGQLFVIDWETAIKEGNPLALGTTMAYLCNRLIGSRNLKNEPYQLADELESFVYVMYSLVNDTIPWIQNFGKQSQNTTIVRQRREIFKNLEESTEELDQLLFKLYQVDKTSPNAIKNLLNMLN